MSRPEHIAPPEVFYNDIEASKYGANSRMLTIQTDLTKRALELAKLTPNSGASVLDIGCGSGISGEVLSEEGHYWVGMDISPSMLLVAKERESEGDLMLNDMGQGFKFRPGSFDCAISISAIQWLCNRDRKNDRPFKRLMKFFQSLYDCLVTGARAVLQFYPENEQQLEMITAAALKVGFSGGLVVDYPNSAKAKKYFLVLNCGAAPQGEDLARLAKTGSEAEMMAKQIAEDGDGTGATKKDKKRKGKKGAKTSLVKTKAWIQNKKTQQRSRGIEVKKDSKFTGRKRKTRF